MFPPDGFDEELPPPDGFDEEVFPLDGFDEEVFPLDGFDVEVFPLDGFDVEVFPLDGFDVEVFPPDGFDEEVFPPDGFVDVCFSPFGLVIVSVDSGIAVLAVEETETVSLTRSVPEDDTTSSQPFPFRAVKVIVPAIRTIAAPTVEPMAIVFFLFSCIHVLNFSINIRIPL